MSDSRVIQRVGASSVSVLTTAGASSVSVLSLQTQLGSPKRLLRHDGAVDFIGGLCGGSLECLSGHPFDTVKVRMVTSGEAEGMYSTMASIVRNEGFCGLYRGVQAPLSGLAFLNACIFLSYGQASKLAADLTNSQQTQLPLTGVFVAGAIAGFPVSFVEGPIEFFKCQLQMQKGLHPRHAKYSGLVDCCRKIIQEKGPHGAMQGGSAVIARNVPAYALYFTAYEWVRRSLAQDGSNAWWHGLPAGAAAGVAFFGPTYPADILKTKLQSQSIHRHEREFQGLWDAARKTYVLRGWRGFTVGMAPCMARSAPANAMCFFGYEACKTAMGCDM